MTSPPHLEGLEERLRAADPLTRSPGELAEWSLALAREVAATTPDRRWWRRPHGRGAVVAAAVAALIVVPAGAYAGSMIFDAQTGTYGAPGGTEEDTSEWIDMCATDVDEYMDSLPTPSEAPPPGWTWSAIAERMGTDLIKAYASDCAKGVGTVEQETSLKAAFYWFGHDRWVQVALDHHRSGQEELARQEARSAAQMFVRLNELGIFADDGVWKPNHDDLINGNWPGVAYDFKVNGSDVTP